MRPTAFVPIVATAGERPASCSAGAATAGAAATNAPASTSAVDAMTLPPPHPQVFKALIFAPGSSRVPPPRERSSRDGRDGLEAAAGIEPAYKVLQTSACATRLRRREPLSVSGGAGVAGVSGTVPILRLSAGVCHR